MQKKILILGGGGFIGWNLAKYLLNQTDSVVHLADNFSRKTKTNLFENYENLKVFECNLLDTESYDNFDNDYDHVYMMAAVVGVDKVNSVPHEVISINTRLTMNTIDWLTKVNCKKVIFTSTSENYAGTIENFGYKIPTPEDVPLTINDPKHPRFTYAITKILGESAFINFARKGYFETSIIRYHNVYGPDMGFRHVIPHLAERFLKNENPFMVYGHDQTRSFNYIDDAVFGTYLAGENGKNMEIYHIGDNDEITIEELVKFVGDLFSFSGEYKAAPTFPGSVSRRCPDITKAQKELSYSPKTNWRNGVSKTIDWYIKFLKQNTEQKESFYDKYGIKK